MGRHAAADGDSVHPVVAAALARRAVDTVAAHHGSAADPHPDQPDATQPLNTGANATRRIDSPVGWPGQPPAGGGGLGWPGDLTHPAPARPSRSAGGETDRSARVDDHAADQPADQAERRADDAAGDEDRADDQAEEPVPASLERGRRRGGWRRLFGLDRAA